MRSVFVAMVAAALFSVPASAQAPTQSEQDIAHQQSPTACCAIPALTEVTITIDKMINSQANRAGEIFPITLAVPIIVDGKTLFPAGAPGSGEIVHAAKSRFGGRAGELILAVRYLEHGGVRVPLRSLRYVEGRGKDRGDTAAAVGVVVGGVVGGIASMLITGGEVTVPAGTLAKAKTAVLVSVPDISPTSATTSPTTEKGSTP
jgi:hypothetical protein